MIRVLFVCEGNTCRSPMAAGIAGALFADAMQAESAGINAGNGMAAADDAVAVMRETYGVDLSAHQARDIASVSAGDFAYVVALSGYVGDCLGADKRILPGRLVIWEIKDPYLKGADAYRRVARDIESRVCRFLRDNIKKDIGRWQREITEGKPAPTGLVGISGKLAANLETLIRDVFRCHLKSQGINYDNALRTEFGGRELDQLTFGAVVKGLRRLNELADREIVRGATLKDLWQLVDLRNRLAHHQGEYARDERTLAQNTDRVLALSYAVTSDDSLFDFDS